VKRVVDSENLALFRAEDGEWWGCVEPNASPAADLLSGQALSMLHLFGFGDRIGNLEGRKPSFRRNQQISR
jgi:hypothetical protein